VAGTQKTPLPDSLAPAEEIVAFFKVVFTKERGYFFCFSRGEAEVGL
jgi:hypothetical protein